MAQGTIWQIIILDNYHVKLLCKNFIKFFKFCPRIQTFCLKTFRGFKFCTEVWTLLKNGVIEVWFWGDWKAPEFFICFTLFFKPYFLFSPRGGSISANNRNLCRVKNQFLKFEKKSLYKNLNCIPRIGRFLKVWTFSGFLISYNFLVTNIS